MYIGVCLPGDLGRHVTITFNGHGESKRDYIQAVAALADAAAEWELLGDDPIWLAFGELHVFDPPGVWVTRVRSKTLSRFRDILCAHLTIRGVYWSDEFEYIPHVTLKYYKKPKENPYENQHMQAVKISVVSDEFGVTEVLV